MKTLKKITLVIGLFVCSSKSFAQVGINTTSPDAQLDVRSSNQAAPSNTDGMLIPKVDTFPAVNPTAAQQGMLVYLTTASGGNAPGFYYWDNTSTSWLGVDGKKGWELNGNSGTTPTTNFIGTTDNQDLAIRTNNTENARLKSNGFMGIGTSVPKSRLHVMGTSTGMTPNAFSVATLESEPSAYLSILSSLETGVVFGGNGTAVNGGIIYNAPGLSDGLSIRTGGNVNRVTISSTGNVGLGNFVPVYPLHFQGTLGDKISLWGNTWNHYGFGIQNDLLQIHTNGNGADVAFGWGNSAAFTETVRIKGTGNVGIGTSTPTMPLEFKSDLGDKICLYNSGPTTYGFGVQNSLLQIHSSYSGSDIAFGWGTSAALNETVRIKGNGNVGIATSTPQSKLHIFSGASGMTPNPAAGATIEDDGFCYLNMMSATECGVLFGANGFSSSGGIIYNSGIYNNGLNFRTGGNQNRMSISSIGNISIGNALPDARLHIMSSNQATPANTDGIIIPKINTFSATNPAAAQEGMMVYLTTTASGKLPGFYYWDNGSTSWKGVGANANWSVTGNSGMSAANNFIGTTDNNDLVFKRNNINAGSIGATNTSYGINALVANTTGNYNVAIGVSALMANDTGSYSVGIGMNALLKNKSAASVGIGVSAMEGNTTGLYNTGLGTNTLHTNATGSYNTAAGYNSLYDNLGSYNTAYGVSSISSNLSGEANAGFGVEALRNNKTGSWNVAIGNAAMYSNTDGEQNTAVGVSAMWKSQSGIYNVAMGMNSLYNNTSGQRNTAIGTGAMYWHDNGSNNTAVGNEAMNNQTAGSNNIGIGKGANMPSLTGSDQLSIGNVIYGTGMALASSAKIGIADSAPDAKLEITASNAATPANTDGILIPRINSFPITNPTASQNGMMVYLTNTIGFYQPGFYYWDNASVNWLAVGSKNNWSTSGNSGTSPVGNFIGTNDNADVAIRTNSSERMRVTSTGDVGIKTSTPTTDFEVNGYTKLGSSAPAIKMIKLTGTTSASAGSSVTIAHGVTTSKIISVSVLVEHAANSYMSPGFTASSGYEFNYYVNGGSIFVVNKSGNSANILSKPIKVVVTYEE